MDAGSTVARLLLLYAHSPFQLATILRAVLRLHASSQAPIQHHSLLTRTSARPVCPSACEIAMPKKGAKGGDAKGKGGKGKDEPPDVSAQVSACMH